MEDWLTSHHQSVLTLKVRSPEGVAPLDSFLVSGGSGQEWERELLEFILPHVAATYVLFVLSPC